MFIASYRNTMANARPKPAPNDDVIRFDMLEAARQRKERERQARIRKEAEQRATIEAQREQIRELMDKGRQAAIRFAIENGVEDDTGRFRHSYALIERRICKALRITRMELHSRRRHKRVTFARQAVMYWACRLTLYSTPEIGRYLGGKDHTSILAGRNRYPEKRAAMGRYLRPVR